MNHQLPISSENSPSFITELLYSLKIADVMTRELITGTKKQPLRHIQHLMKENTITGVPIVDGERIVGIVSVDDIIQALDGGYIDEAVENHMSRNIIVLESDMPLSFGISYMEKYHFGRFPVIDKERKLVGIITSRDIIMALLLEVNKELQQLEDKLPKTKEERGGAMLLEFSTRKFDFEHAGKPTSQLKKELKQRNIDRKIIRRIAVAAYELEMNQVVHSDGGRMTFKVETDRVEIIAQDRGPGIPDIEAALTEGFSTANEWIRSLGFGAGMGLPNTRRVSDHFDLSSDTSGTCAHAIIYLNQGASHEGS